MIRSLYQYQTGLFTDFYELTMAYGYFKHQMQDTEAVFSLFYRSNPFHSGYVIACGLEQVIDYLKNFTFSDEDIAFLAEQKGTDGGPLFDKPFLDYLKNFVFSCDVYAVPEGTVVFPYEPLLTIHGSLIQAQILETALLNIINFQSLIATKASRVCRAAQGDPVLDFGLRRAQGPDGGLSATRASYIGGCTGTSNVLAGRLFDIPVKGTHAHSWVMAFDNEVEAFKAYADAMPGNCILLTDTYNTLQGIKHAIDRGLDLKEKGFRLIGIRLDSGDLATLSKQARKMLDQAGLQDAAIVASNELDEYVIEDLKNKGASVDLWGVGTKLVTSYDQPALGGVYKLTALKNKHGVWQYKLKLSEEPSKISDPGLLQVKRYYDGEKPMADMIYHVNDEQEEYSEIANRQNGMRMGVFRNKHYKDLLIPVFRQGKCVYTSPDIHAIRENAEKQLSNFSDKYKLLHEPETYAVGLHKTLYNKKHDVIKQIKAEEWGT